jgi:hypothetical protein
VGRDPRSRAPFGIGMRDIEGSVGHPSLSDQGLDCVRVLGDEGTEPEPGGSQLRLNLPQSIGGGLSAEVRALQSRA